MRLGLDPDVLGPKQYKITKIAWNFFGCNCFLVPSNLFYLISFLVIALEILKQIKNIFMKKGASDTDKR